MRSINTLLALLLFSNFIFGQTSSVKGQLQDAEGKPVMFANVALFDAADSSLVKVEASTETGIFHLKNIKTGRFFIKSSFVGLPDFLKKDIALADGQQLDLGVLTFSPAGKELAEVTVSALRPMLEVRADRTIFNVQGTINSTGSDAMNLLRKAPAVMIDNNENITVLGRPGVLVYVDGKRVPLSGADLSNYLQNIPAEQIDRIDIITTPGAKYEAQGNAGIIDVRLKKDKNMGGNGSVGGTFSQGNKHRANLNASGNYRNKKFNVFGNGGLGDRIGYMKMDFESTQNGLWLGESVRPENDFQNQDFRLGTDFFISKKHTIGFLVSGGAVQQDGINVNTIKIAPQSTPENIDSTLVANTHTLSDRNNTSGNLNYRFDNGKGRTLNLDLDHAVFKNTNDRRQTNDYFGPNGGFLRGSAIVFDAPSDIQISSAKADWEQKLLGGTLGLGSKMTRVLSKNDFLVYDEIGGAKTRDDRRSNLFDYDEKVYAGYGSFVGKIDEKWGYSAGLRVEKTDATGDLTAFKPELEEAPVVQDYLSWFPSAGLTWQVSPMNSWSANYSRRINRPDYHVLNPFNNQLSELSFEKGNPRLKPEIVNNVEIGYTFKYMYAFKLGYSVTTDQITRLIGPDSLDARANYINWENLAEQKTLGFNVSAPFTITKWWDAYVNFSAMYLKNVADYGDGAIVDVEAATYNIYQQSTFKLPGGFRGEVSGWFAGPGVWGGVFKTDSQWSLDLGLQKKFLKDALNVRLSMNDVFFQSWWSGVSVFDGLTSKGYGQWDSRRVAVSAAYNFGNQNVKSRKRSTGLEDEAKRVGSGD